MTTITIKSRAEDKFAAIQRQKEIALEESENAQRARAEKVSRLRSLRLARDANGEESAGKKSNGKKNGKAAAENTPPQLPRAHRR